jgi:hypothetical protein
MVDYGLHRAQFSCPQGETLTSTDIVDFVAARMLQAQSIAYVMALAAENSGADRQDCLPSRTYSNAAWAIATLLDEADDVLSGRRVCYEPHIAMARTCAPRAGEGNPR